MKAKLIRIGNSRGIRIPQELVRIYNLREGAELELERRREGILLCVASDRCDKISWEDSYKEMAAESAERKEWSEWDATAGDGGEG
jgi:antitoxin component of MazEF toxin-antitoxin module